MIAQKELRKGERNGYLCTTEGIVVKGDFPHVHGLAGYVGVTYTLFKISEGGLIVKSKQSGGGLALIMPVYSSESFWYRYHPVATPSTPDPDLVSYLKMIQKKVHSIWKYPTGVLATQAVTLRFVLDIDGKLVSAEVVDSTDARLNSSAMEAMNRALPFPPIPDNLKRLVGKPLVIKFTVSSKP
jgi:TonB family protein